MILVAFPAVYRSVAGWLKRYFRLLTAVCTGCFVHLSWSSETASPFAEAASSFVAHMLISFVLVLLSKGCDREFPHVPSDLDRDLVFSLRAGQQNHKALCLKGIQARAETKSIVIPHTVLPVFGISISFKPWGFHEPK